MVLSGNRAFGATVRIGPDALIQEVNMQKNTHGTRSELIHCDNCGEDYNNSYKRCPFCGARADRSAYTQPTSRLDLGERAGAGAAAGRRSSGEGRASSSQQSPVQDEDDYVFDGGDVFDDDEDDYKYGDRRGGKRLSGIGQITPTAIIGFLFSAAVIAAAILIIVLVIVPMVQGGRTATASNTPPTSLPPVTTSPGPSLPVSPSPSASDPGPVATDPVEPTGDPGPSPSPTASPSASGNLRLTYGGKLRTELSINDAYPNPVQLRAEGASGTVTWTSSNTAVATVDTTGKITRVGPGQCRVTATDASGQSTSCLVRCSGTPSGSAASPSPSPSPSPSASTTPAPSPSPSASETGTLTLSKTDITISVQFPSPVTIKVTGASGTVTWTSSNTAVATVDDNGKVTKVGTGQCRVTAADESGQTASCIVRCTG